MKAGEDLLGGWRAVPAAARAGALGLRNARVAALAACVSIKVAARVMEACKDLISAVRVVIPTAARGDTRLCGRVDVTAVSARRGGQVAELPVGWALRIAGEDSISRVIVPAAVVVDTVAYRNAIVAAFGARRRFWSADGSGRRWRRWRWGRLWRVEAREDLISAAGSSSQQQPEVTHDSTVERRSPQSVRGEVMSHVAGLGGRLL
eukprot:CAMPEP_0115849970 /NCGR_PEP_ID=MMETSP0287-20121206/11724_1 /TAXON_ID=412157 /ORGANISM="Chrysochromulina rotalis, Strain UIO044" /LENGTH=205 /DNA_ID=CAMNT_0003303955 /DNA_START=476 /DNA_END=1094 /DNA_ORIENTATION=-